MSKMFEQMEKYIEMLSFSSSATSGDLETVAEGLAGIRRMLSIHPTQNPRSELINKKCNGVKKLIHCLDSSNSAVQYDAAWCLSNISSVSESNAQLVIEHGALPRLIKLLESPTEQLREQSAWCLGNMFFSGEQPVREARVMQPLLTCLNSENKNIATLRNATWLLTQVLRYKPFPDFELVEVCLPTVRRLLEHPVAEIQEDACWAVSNISDGDEARINAVMNYNVMPIVLDLLKTQRETVVLPAVRTFGNFCATNPEMTQIIIDQGILNYLAPLLQPNISREVRKEVCFLISNVCVGYDGQVEAVIEAGLFPPVINNMYATAFEVLREATFAVVNATATSSVDRIRFLVEGCDALEGLCNVLTTKDSKICNIALEAIEAILIIGDKFRPNNNGINPYVDRVKSIHGGKDNIARLRDHICHTVFLRSATLMDRYFEDEWNAVDYDDNNNDNNNDGKKQEEEEQQQQQEEQEDVVVDVSNTVVIFVKTVIIFVSLIFFIKYFYINCILPINSNNSDMQNENFTRAVD